MLLLTLVACGSLEDFEQGDGATISSGVDGDLPIAFSRFSDNVTVYQDDDEIVIETDDIPNHTSPYFPTNDSQYEAPDSDMVVNPNSIAEQDYVFRIPLEAFEADEPTETNLGAIGVALNGVVMFNQYAGRTLSGDWLPLDDEIMTFDRYNGHPAQQDNYHYHLEPLYLTADDPSAQVGVMLDGFPIYGPEEVDGTTPDDLDECNGHLAQTPDHSEAVYHYHVTEEVPYLIGCYRGTPGTVSN